MGDIKKFIPAPEDHPYLLEVKSERFGTLMRGQLYLEEGTEWPLYLIAIEVDTSRVEINQAGLSVEFEMKESLTDWWAQCPAPLGLIPILVQKLQEIESRNKV